jgi:thiamine pyrophosphokinase
MMHVVIVANGVIADPQAEFDRWVREDSVLVAADGGTNHLLACGLYPQHILGDLDSISTETRMELEARQVAFHTFPPNKDETDLELALLWAVCQYPTAVIVVLGALGGRPDQTLANALLLIMPQLRGKDIVIADGQWRVRAIHGGETRYFDGTVGDTLSLIPLGGPTGGVTTTGLLYPLTDETLHFGPGRGVSNVFIADTATISVARGTLWVFHKRDE